MLFLNLVGLKGTHIVGGELTYQHKGNNVYTIRLDLYIDCENGNPDAIASDAQGIIAFFDGTNSTYIANLSESFNGNNIGGLDGVSRQGPLRLAKLNYNCIQNSPNACVNHYWYVKDVTLPARAGGYIIAFQRCCRNNSITNLFNPGGQGAVYWTHIPNPSELPNKKQNSSAIFKEKPPNFLCTNTPLRFDHSATDADGDSLVYELFRPYAYNNQSNPRPNEGSNGDLDRPPFRQVNWEASYNEQVPIDGNPKLEIDRETGMLTLTPTRVGQFVIGIRVLEYRKGVLIGETKRDYQFNIQNCIIDVVASYFAPKYICGYTYTFANRSSGAQRYFWDFGVPNVSNDTSRQATPTFTFPAAGKYTVKLIAYKNNCLDSTKQVVEVVEPLKPKLPRDTAICPGSSVLLQSNIVAEQYLWSTGSRNNSINVNTRGDYWLEITVKTCKWRDTFSLFIDNYQVNAIGDTAICTDNNFSHTLRVQTIRNNFQYTWSNGITGPVNVITKAGKYYLTSRSNIGCITRDSAIISVFPPLGLAAIDTLKCPGLPVTLSANVTGATFQWSTGVTSSSITVINPGTYSLTATRGVCKETVRFNVINHPNELVQIPDYIFCERVDTIVSLANRGYKSVKWDDIGATSLQYRINKAGNVKYSIENSNGCLENSDFDVFVFPNPTIQLPADTTVCLSVHPKLNAIAPNPNYRYLWSTGSTEPMIQAFESGKYWLRVTDKNGCFNSDTVEIIKRGDLYPSQVYMPNAFTPNGDGLNDFYPDNKYQLTGAFYNVKIFNRWGEKLADYDTPKANWDGTVNGNPVPEGVYVYLVNWIGCDNQRHRLRGDFHVLR